MTRTCALLLWLPFAAFAGAEPSLERAQALATQLDYPGALAQAQGALQRGRAAPEDTLALHTFIAQMAAAVGQQDVAVDAFRAVLSLAPEYQLPAGASPKLTRPLALAREKTFGQRLEVSVRSRAAGPGQVETEVRVLKDPAALVAAARLYASDAGRFSAKVTLVPGKAGQTWPCAAAPCAHFVALVDRYGNEVARLGSPFLPLPVEGVEAVAVTPAKPWVRPATVLAAAAVVAAGVAVGFGARYAQTDRALADIEANRANARYAPAAAVDADRRQAYVLMWVGAGLAVGSGGAAALTW